MNTHYRVKYKKGDFEIEVESDNKAYVDSKLSELLEKPLLENPPKKSSKKKGKKAVNDGLNNEEDEEKDIIGLVEYINESDDFNNVEKNILQKSSQIGRVMMCLYFAKDYYDDPNLTTGQIEKITDQLGVKITSENASGAIKRGRKYFTADQVLKKGAIMKYKLNKKGIEAIKKLISGGKLE